MHSTIASLMAAKPLHAARFYALAFASKAWLRLAAGSAAARMSQAPLPYFFIRRPDKFGRVCAEELRGRSQKDARVNAKLGQKMGADLCPFHGLCFETALLNLVQAAAKSRPFSGPVFEARFGVRGARFGNQGLPVLWTLRGAFLRKLPAR